MTLSRKGIALISVIIIMLTMALIGASLVELVSVVNTSSQVTLDETKARYLAEAGIAYAVWMLRSKAGSKATLEKVVGPMSLGDGSYTIYFNTREAMITSVGTVNQVSKKLQLQYNVF